MELHRDPTVRIDDDTKRSWLRRAWNSLSQCALQPLKEFRVFRRINLAVESLRLE